MLENHQGFRVSGWGFPHGDEGGAAWLGMEAIRLTLKYVDGRIPSTPLLTKIFQHFAQDSSALVTWANQATAKEFGEISPLVVHHADTDSHAHALLAQAAAEIDLIAQVLQSKSQKKSLPIGLLGGLAPFIAPHLSAKVRACLVPAQHDAARGAIFMVKQQVLGSKEWV
jgi:glucosamine kinase